MSDKKWSFWTHERLEWCALFVFLAVVVLVCAWVGISGSQRDREASEKRESLIVVVYTDLTKGKPVSKTTFDSAFPVGKEAYREVEIRRAAKGLGVPPEDMLNMMQVENLSVVYTGKAPAKIQPANAVALDGQ